MDRESQQYTSLLGTATMVFCSALLLSTFFFVFSASMYRASILTTDVSWRWEAPPVMADILAFGVLRRTEELNSTLELLGDTPAQSVVIDVVDQIVVETIAPVTVPELSSTPTSTTPIDCPPNQTSLRLHPTRYTPTVTRALSNLRTLRAFILSAFLLVVSAIIVVLKRASKPTQHRPVSTPVYRPLPPPVTGSSARTLFFTLVFAITIAIASGLFIIQNLLSEKPSAAFDVRPFLGHLCEHFGITAFYAMVSAVLDTLERGQEIQESGTGQGEVAVEDMPVADQVSINKAGPLPVLNVEALRNTASLPSGNLARSDIIYLSIRSADAEFALDIPQAQDTSVTHESISAQSVLSLYATVPEQNSVSRAIIEDMAVEYGVVEYDATESIASAIRSVASLDDLRAMTSTMSFPSVDDLAMVDTHFERLRQAVFDEITESTETTVPSSSALLSVTDLRPTDSVWYSVSSWPGDLESTGGFIRYNADWSSNTKELWAIDFLRRFVSDENLMKDAYLALLSAISTETAGVEYLSDVDEGLDMSMVRSSFERPSNPVLRFSSSDSSFDDAEVEDSFERSTAMPIRKGVLSPSRIPVGSWRRRILFVPLVQTTGLAHTGTPSPSHIPIWSGRVQRPGKDVASSIPSLQPNQRNSKHRRSPRVAPTMRQQEESGSPARRARRCLSCSKSP
ncbi:hypothetical protein DFS33DRAFT_965617 [Desarmillaria ectypa]|nr:hypothetical protein DFS33DRAFT_965617 [Desarmillaria ectypa]